eukprot:CAMPEP_0184861100 /NCGR_PEP_ID=MMETSP0580-20130426/5870_1 /TAXON_ID=1118495 /ORGANISM="Dactyliosolen fragilissimus" /LENGTH=205 /DNA_ID=CAMNT_0027358475 /DNA_START=17 /DNA_END=631 /DNA_ORIENTATION=+
MTRFLLILLLFDLQPGVVLSFQPSSHITSSSPHLHFFTRTSNSNVRNTCMTISMGTITEDGISTNGTKSELIEISNVMTDESKSRGIVSFDAYLRFSPLIGGPPSIPLHVEVILVTEDGQSDINHAARRKILHRLDFLPKYPMDPRLTLDLLTFQSVPGLVRHRIFGTCAIDDNQDYMQNQEKNNGKYTILDVSNDNDPKNGKDW